VKYCLRANVILSRSAFVSRIPDAPVPAGDFVIILCFLWPEIYIPPDPGKNGIVLYFREKDEL